LLLRTQVDIVLGIIAKLFRREKRRIIGIVPHRKIGSDPVLFEFRNVSDGSICGVTHGNARMHLPTKTHPPRATSSIGILSVIVAGVTKAARITRAFPPSTTECK
jgi:hypothetical protein